MRDISIVIEALQLKIIKLRGPLKLTVPQLESVLEGPVTPHVLKLLEAGGLLIKSARMDNTTWFYVYDWDSILLRARPV